MKLPTPPPEKLTRVIISSDVKNEADDQYAIVHALLSPSLEIHGISPAQFGTRKSATSLQDSHDELVKVLDLMGIPGAVRIADGAATALPDDQTPLPSPGAALIIEQATADDPRPLHVGVMGPMTEVASALLMEPRIADKDIRVVFTGGTTWPLGGYEYNFFNDVHAANVVLRSRLQRWMIPYPTFKWFAVSYAELFEKVHDKGPLGRYLVEQLVDYNTNRWPDPIEYRSLGDSPIVTLMIQPDAGQWEWRPAPDLDLRSMNYIHTGRNPPMRVYDWIDGRFCLEDFFAKFARWHRGLANWAKLHPGVPDVPDGHA